MPTRPVAPGRPHTAHSEPARPGGYRYSRQGPWMPPTSTSHAPRKTVETDAATLVNESTNTIRADRSRLRQLLENLIRNAVEHGGTDIKIRVGDLDGGFFVEDDGEGVPSEDRDRVFVEGYSSNGGSGPGLQIVRQIANAHGWNIELRASRDGGARFEVTGVEQVE